MTWVVAGFRDALRLLNQRVVPKDCRHTLVEGAQAPRAASGPGVSRNHGYFDELGR